MAIDPAASSVPGTAFSESPMPDAARVAPGTGPYRLAARRLRRNRVALAFGGLFVLISVLCALAPVYSHEIAHIAPDQGNVTGTVKVGGQVKNIVSPEGIPIGPTWGSRYFLGADNDGRDVAVRLLYGGRNSLEIGLAAALITLVLATLLGLVAGFYRGVTDGIISRALDLIWSYPAVLLGVALGTSLEISDKLDLGPISVARTSLWLPIVIIGIVYVPYVAKPLRAQVLGLREREFIDAARTQGMSSARILYSELLPNLASTLIVFVPLMVANAILLEAALSYLGAGVQAPNPSWGTMMADGIHQLPAAIHQVLVPGIMLVLAVLGINVFGDGVRDALDPRATVRIEH